MIQNKKHFQFDERHHLMLCKDNIDIDGTIRNLKEAVILSHSKQCNPWKLQYNGETIYVAHKKCDRENCRRSKKQCIGTCPNTLLFTTNYTKAKKFKPEVLKNNEYEKEWKIYKNYVADIKMDIPKLCQQNDYSDSEASD